VPYNGCGDGTLAFLFQDAELAVGDGHIGLVAEPLEGAQGALVLAGGLVIVPAVLGEDAELEDRLTPSCALIDE
jgi:hypothetical protein